MINDQSYIWFRSYPSPNLSLRGYIERIIFYLEVMFLMQLSENIHDGHGPGVLGPEDLQHEMQTLVKVAMKNPEETF